MLKQRFAEVFRTRTRDEWTTQFADVDACVTPVLSPREAARHPYNTARNVFAVSEAGAQPQPAPRFSRTPGRLSRPPTAAGAGTREGLAGWGLSEERVNELRDAGAFG
jgi:alpha-methylacyl-CoA racemase